MKLDYELFQNTKPFGFAISFKLMIFLFGWLGI